MRFSRFFLAALGTALSCAPPLAFAQATDTTYTLSADQGSATGLYPHYFTLTRGTATIGFVVEGAANAGSCANVWCAIVPGVSTNSWNQSGGTFASFSAAAHEVVRVWNATHPSPVAPPPSVTVDSSYTTTRVPCPPHGSITCYVVRQQGAVVGSVRQDSTEKTYKWIATTPAGVMLTPGERTLSAAALRLALLPHPAPAPTPVPDTVRVPVTIYDTTHVPVRVYDTTRVKVTIYDTVHVAVDTTHTTGAPELPRYTAQMDAMLASARASDTVTRQVFDLVGQTLVPRTDAVGRAVCGNGGPSYFPCPPAVVAAVKARAARATQAARARSARP